MQTSTQRQSYHSPGESQFRGLPHRDPWLAAMESDFRNPDDYRVDLRDRRDWKARCSLKRQVWRGLVKCGVKATAKELASFLHLSERYVKFGLQMLSRQGFISVARHLSVRRNGETHRVGVVRRLHPERLGQWVPTVYTCAAPPPAKTNCALYAQRTVPSKFPQESLNPTTSQDQGFGVRPFPQREPEKEKITRPLTEEEKEQVRKFLAEMAVRKRLRELWAR